MNENQSTMGKTSKITPIKAIERTEQVTTITELNAESYQMLKEWLHNTFMLHTDSSLTGCEFVSTSGASPSEDNFGYNKVINNNFRCNAGDFSTIQWWPS